MKRLLTILTATLCLASCTIVIGEPAKGEIIEKSIAISGEPVALAISHGFDVVVDPTLPRGEVRVSTHSDLMDLVEIRMEDATLNIKLKSTTLRAKTLSVRVPEYDFNTVAISGGADLEWHNCKANTLTVAASGGADAEITTLSERVTLAVSGGANVELKGSSKQLSIAASGGADIDTSELKAESVEVSASGGADVEVYATSSLSVEASGGADVSYTGNPATKSINTSGAADVWSKGIDD